MNDKLTTTQTNREVLQSYGEAPLPTSSLYSHRYVRTREDGVEEHVIVGVHIIFQAKHSNGFYEAFNVSRESKQDAGQKVATRAMLIACDTLEIFGELSLPECDVAIYARKLVFRNRGSINTSPLIWAKQKAADAAGNTGGANGADGRNGGKLTVFIGEFDPTEHESMKRFICRGGRGQDAGHGKNGDDGTSMTSIGKMFFYQQGSHRNSFEANFTTLCVYAKYHWHLVGIVINKGEEGSNAWPGDGKDALKPGVPGSGGNGGAWVSNQKKLLELLDNTPDDPGKMAPNVTGGAAGTPINSAHYELTIRFELISETAGGDTELQQTHTTHGGKSFQAEGADKKRGTSPQPVTFDSANAWIHPLQLESVLRYARDAFLNGARNEVSTLLKPYESVLAAALPTGLGNYSAWSADDAARWNSAQAEVASILHRLRLQLDYFGNPAGYMPFLSLQATMRLYDLETNDALRTLLLAGWVQSEANKAQSASNAFGKAIEDTTKDTNRVAEQLVQAEGDMVKLNQQLTSLETRIRTKSTELATLRTNLLNQAGNIVERQKFIKFGIKMAAAICQAVPVGQPVLGTLGKLANIAADISEEGTPDTISKIGDTIKKAREADKKAQAAKEKAAKKAKESIDAKEAKEEASAWAKAGDGLGAALSMAGEAIGALEVSEEEVEVELAKLTAASSEWNVMVEDIRILNKDKAKLFKQLSAVLQAIGDGYARLASNADSVVTMQVERNKTLAKLSPEANQMVARLGQAARLSLQRSLYLMVKAYETTVFKPIHVDWSLDEVFDKITELLKPAAGFDAATIDKFLTAVAPLFEANKKTVRDNLLKEYGFGLTPTSPLEFGFTSEGSVHELEALRQGRSLTLNPLALGLIRPHQERAKAIGFECKEMVFDESGPKPPASGNAIISLRLNGDSTVRRDEHLYAVRSDAPRIWSWTYLFSNKSLEASVPSITELDLLNLILSSQDNAIKQKLAAPPVWSDLIINLEFTPQIEVQNRPRLKRLMFDCKIESAPVLAPQSVLDVRSEGVSERVGISPADLAGRSDGFGDSYRIYNKADKVTLVAPPQVGGRSFSDWYIVDSGSSRTDKNSKTDVVLNSDTLAYCRYRAVVRGTQQPADGADQVLLIRAGTDANEPVIGLVLEGEQPTILEDAANGWMKVTYKGLVGYIAR